MSLLAVVSMTLSISIRENGLSCRQLDRKITILKFSIDFWVTDIEKCLVVVMCCQVSAVVLPVICKKPW